MTTGLSNQGVREHDIDALLRDLDWNENKVIERNEWVPFYKEFKNLSERRQNEAKAMFEQLEYVLASLFAVY